jgi:hypothetical protein
LRASTKKKQIAGADIIEYSEDLSNTNFSSGDDDDIAIHAKPLDSHPPPRAGKRTLLNFGLNAS